MTLSLIGTASIPWFLFGIVPLKHGTQLLKHSIAPDRNLVVGLPHQRSALYPGESVTGAGQLLQFGDGPELAALGRLDSGDERLGDGADGLTFPHWILPLCKAAHGPQ